MESELASTRKTITPHAISAVWKTFMMELNFMNQMTSMDFYRDSPQTKQIIFVCIKRQERCWALGRVGPGVT